MIEKSDSKNPRCSDRRTSVRRYLAIKSLDGHNCSRSHKSTRNPTQTIRDATAGQYSPDLLRRLSSSQLFVQSGSSNYASANFHSPFEPTPTLPLFLGNGRRTSRTVIIRNVAALFLYMWIALILLNLLQRR